MRHRVRTGFIDCDQSTVGPRGVLPALFEVRPGTIMQLVDLAETVDVRIGIDAEVKAGALIRHDGNKGAVAHGDCVMVQARNVAVRMADDLPRGAVVTGVYALA